MASKPKPTEAEIHKKAFSDFTRHDQWLLSNFLGWHYRQKSTNKDGKVVNHTPTTHFYREFDLLNFEKDVDGDIKLTGYEIKGYDKSGASPKVGDGLGQVLAYLLQGVDFGYLIIPEPEREQDRQGWKDICECYSRLVGLIYYRPDLTSYYVERKADQNPHITRDRKRNILISASVHGLFDKSTDTPLWIKKQDF